MERITHFFASVRLTIILFILIVALSILGTVIPQQEGAAAFAARLSPEAARWLSRFQFFDLYHSALFYALMAMLSLNLIICSLKRFPAAWKNIQPEPFPVPETLLTDIAADQQMTMTDGRDKAVRVIEPLLNKKFGKIAKNASDCEVVFFCQRGRLSHLGVYIVHASVLLIIAGAVIGSLLGFEGYVTIVEGQSVQRVEGRRGGDRLLNFAVRCDRFIVDYYDNGAPKTYRSDLSFLREGRVLYQGSVLVNHPISFGGFRFYQSNFEVLPGGKALLAYTALDAAHRQLVVAEGSVFELPKKDARITVLRVENNLMEMGPAVKLRIDSPQGQTQLWVFQHIDEIMRKNPGLLSWMPSLNPGLFKPYSFNLRRVEFPYVTGLQVMHDPGAPFVAAGALLMICGLMVTFWMPHRRFWVRIEEVDGRACIVLAGKSNRNQPGLAKEIRQLGDSVREAING